MTHPRSAGTWAPIQALTCAALVAALTLVPQVAQAASASLRLTLQDHIDKHVPLNEASWPWAHNSFNSSAYDYPYPNQQQTLTQDLDAGVRMIDIDPIWDNADQRIEACHGICGDGDDPAVDRFQEITDWFNDPTYGAERRENDVVLLYLEADPGDLISDIFQGWDTKFDQLQDDLKSSALLGENGLVYTPVDYYNGATGHCTSFESFAADVTKADILAAGKNVLILGAKVAGLDNTCTEDNYQDVAFKIDVADPVEHWNFNGYPDCDGGNFPGHSKFSNAYNDVATIAHTDSMSLEEIDNLVGCGVNAVSHEEFVTNSWEHQRLVWSWNSAEPDGAGEDCAAMRISSGSDWGIWDRDCSESNKYACVKRAPAPEEVTYSILGVSITTTFWGTGSTWKVTEAGGPWTEGAQTCYQEFGPSFQFGVPANGYQYNQLFDVAGGGTTWLNFNDRDDEGDWEPMQQFTQAAFSLDGTPDGLLHGTSTIPMNNSGASSTSDRFGIPTGAYDFDRSQGDKLTGDYDLELGKNLTLSAWFKADPGIGYSNSARLVELSKDGTWSTSSAIYFRDGQLFASCTQEGTTTHHGGLSTSAIYEDGRWHHAAYVADGSTGRLYVDGVLQAEAGDACGDIQDVEKIVIGGHYLSSNYGFDGAIDDVRVYGVALTSADVAGLAGLTKLADINANTIAGGDLEDGSLVVLHLGGGEQGDIVYQVRSDETSKYIWPARFSLAINDQLDYNVMAGEMRDGVLTVLNSQYRNSVWGNTWGTHAAIEAVEPREIGTISGPELSAGDVVRLRVRYGTVPFETFTYTVPDDFWVKAYRWPAALAEMINAQEDSTSVRAGEYSGTALTYPHSTWRNKVWLPDDDPAWNIAIDFNP
jgi:hypothetical protein